jgi:hypothetical protein
MCEGGPVYIVTPHPSQEAYNQRIAQLIQQVQSSEVDPETKENLKQLRRLARSIRLVD